MKLIQYSAKGRRANNEDYTICKQITDGKTLLLIADGMGGYECGEEAAKIVADSVCQSLSKDGEISIESAINAANMELSAFKDCKGIDTCGCTLSGVLIKDNSAQVFWAGDARVYQFRKGKEIFHTEDHSLVNEMKKIRVLSPEQIERYENIVRRAIMGSADDVVEECEISLLPGDELLICSDGLYKDMPVEIAIMKLRSEGDSFAVSNSKFEDNHSLIYATI